MGGGGRGRRALVFGVALGAFGATAGADDVALTVSGLPSALRAERAARIAGRSVAIQFRAPLDGTLRAVHLLWRGPTAGCTVVLHADADGTPGPVLAAGAVPRGTGWRATRLAAPLAAGAAYHMTLACDAGSRARLVYALGAGDVATADAWRLEGDVPRAATPLFALELADDSWWGSPYRAARRSLRVCGTREVGTVFTPAHPMAADGVELAVRGGGRTAVEYTLGPVDGPTLLAGTLRRAPGARGRIASADAASVELVPGLAYVLRVRAPTAASSCIALDGLTTDLPLGPAASGLRTTAVLATDDGGASWRAEPVATLAGALSARGQRCGNGHREGHESCDRTDDAACPGRCTAVCTCAGATSTTATTTSTTSTTATTTTTLVGRRYRSIYTSGYLGVYDPATIPVWPTKLGVILGGPDVQGPLIDDAKQVAAAAGNTDARFVFYLNLTSLDSRCGCFEARFYQSIASTHPEWFLRDASGNRISAFVTQYGAGRLWTVDIGNPAFIDAWADTVIAEMDRHGWDGVWADNILRGNFYDWSAWPVNPRTGAAYTTAEYRQDTLAALLHLRSRLDPRGKILIGNYGSAWEPDTLADPVVQQQIVAMHGVEVEDCVYTFSGTPHSETTWMNQLKYLDFANRRGVLTQCRGGNGTIGDATKRDYILASYLLTKERFSNVGQLNGLSAWWPGLETDLGAPLGGYTCLDPAAGLAPTTSCPSTGKIYAREWERGRVLANPTGGITATIPLGETMLLNGTRVSSVRLGPKSGVVLVRP
jgi:hypothetical protein